eukprot:Rhum_TRINITY_DN7611_c0_g1::Rhum_TRINITY_DN7611_c0_g1_i1::g.23787::m.23787
MTHAFVTPWSTPVTEHTWYVASADEKKDYALTRKYRQSIIDKHFVIGTRYSPTWAYWGPPAIMAGFQSWWCVSTTYRPYWRHFAYFPVFYFLDMVLHRMWREMYAEYQIHKILTWGQYEISASKRRAGGAKDHAVTVSERRTLNDYEGMALGHKNGTILPTPGSGYAKSTFGNI